MATDAYARAPAHDHSAPRRAPSPGLETVHHVGVHVREVGRHGGALALDARQEQTQRVIGGWRRCRGRGGRGVVVDGDGGEGGATRVASGERRGEDGVPSERARRVGRRRTRSPTRADARGHASARNAVVDIRARARRRARPERGPVRRAEPRAGWFCPRTRVDLVCGRLDDASSRRYRHRASRHAVVSLQSAVRRLARRRGASARSRAAHARARLVRLDRSHPRDARRLARAPRRFFGRSPRARARRAFASSPATLLTILRAFLVLFAPPPRAGAYSSWSCDARSGHGALDSGDGGYTLTRASGALHPGERVVLTLSKPLGGCRATLPDSSTPRAEPSSPSRRTPPPPRRATPATPSDTPAPPQNRPRRRTSPSRPRAASSKSKRTSSCTGMTVHGYPPPRRSLVVFVERSLPSPRGVFGPRPSATDASSRSRRP